MSTRMKPSGIDWIGDIPEEWTIKNGKYIFSLFGNNLSEDELIEMEIAGAKRCIYYKVDDMNATTFGFEMNYDISNYYCTSLRQIIKAPVVLIPKRGAAIYTNKVRISNQDCFIDPNIMALKTSQNIKFMSYFIYGRTLADIGDVSSIPQINNKHINHLKVAFPTIQEQQAIASFLDEQCEKIDSIIADMEQQIEVLKKYKTALITEMVAKGLDKSALMNDSGIDWIGKIPAHWEVKPIKYSLLSNEKVLKETTRDDYVIRYIDIGSVDFDNGITRYEEINFENAPARARRVVKKGDTIISTVRTYLKAIARIVDDKDVIVSTGFAVLSPQKNDSIFVEYFCKSEGFCSEIEKLSYGIAYPAINESVLINIKIILPPIKEQKIIASYLDTKCKEITNIINDKQSSISIMKDYKKSLIYEYVTGKKRVTI